jgi:hypothetical protein
MASSIEAVDASSSRQKNCNSCVQTKRRCDRSIPVCSRCAERNTPCIYSKTKAASQPNNPEIEPTSFAEATPFDSSAYSLYSPGLSLDVEYLGDMPATDSRSALVAESPHQQITDASSSGDVIMGNFIDFIGNSSSPSPNQWLVPTDEGLTLDRPNTPADVEIMKAYQMMSLFCVSIIEGLSTRDVVGPRARLMLTPTRITLNHGISMTQRCRCTIL